MACSKLAGRTRGRAKGGALTLPPSCWLASMVYPWCTYLVPVSYLPCGSRSTWEVRDRYEIGTPWIHRRTTSPLGRRLASRAVCRDPGTTVVFMVLLPTRSKYRNVVFLSKPRVLRPGTGSWVRIRAGDFRSVHCAQLPPIPAPLNGRCAG